MHRLHPSDRMLPVAETPANACDCHMHIYDSRFPVAETAALRPPDALVEDYQQLQRRIGTERLVVVTPSTYGTDNRCTLEALARLGDCARGVAVVDTAISTKDMIQMDSCGIRGIRFNLTIGAVTTIDMIEPLSRRVHDLGWHVEVNISPEQLCRNESVLERLATPLVLDHMARIPLGADLIREPSFKVVQRLLDKGKTWIKLSGAYIGSKVGPPSFSDAGELARAFVRLAPERLVWGSNWPHPTHQRDTPDDAALFDLLAEWIPMEGTRRQVLVGNPQSLYGWKTPEQPSRG